MKNSTKAKTRDSSEIQIDENTVNLETHQNRTVSGCRPNSDISVTSEVKTKPKQLNKNQRQNLQDGTNRKLRKNFTGKFEKDRFVESYKMKKKTELCKNWELNGTCKFGTDCAFAHGEHEIVAKNHLPENYKTKL